MVTERLNGREFFTLRDFTTSEIAVILDFNPKFKIDFSEKAWVGRWNVPVLYEVENCKHTQNRVKASITQ